MGRFGPATAELMQRIFTPRSVAVVGVPRGKKTGRLFLEALLKPGFHGDIYPVNPKADEILGLKAYPSVEAIGRPVDLVIVVTPPQAAASVIADCGRAGVGAAALFTAGFGELHSAEGDRREAELIAAAEASGVRLIGPNCMGVYSPAVALASYTNMPVALGDVGFISQSGSLTNFFASHAIERGFATSKAVSVGNQLDLDLADFLRYFVDDPDTRVICLYVEAPPDGRAFFEALKYAAPRKPVVLWKSGRTAGGARAARSHTGALAGASRVWEAVARQTGALPVTTIETMVDAVVALRMRPAPRGDRLAVITGPGGPSISAVDAAEEAGLSLATLSSATIEALAAEINAVGTSPRNPVDVGLILYGPQDVYGRVAAIAGADAGVDGVIVIGGGADAASQTEFARLMSEVKVASGKPLAQISFRPIVDASVLRRYGEAGIGLFPTAERAVQAYALVSRYAAFREEVGASAEW